MGVTTSQYVNFSQPHLQFFVSFVLQAKVVSLCQLVWRALRITYQMTVYYENCNALSSGP